MNTTLSTTPTPALFVSPARVTAAEPGIPTRRRPRAMAALGLAAVLAVSGWGGRAFIRSLAYESTDDAFVEAHVVQFSPKVSAHVVQVLCDDNLEVQAGQRLVNLDGRDYENALRQARASLVAARSRLAQARAQQEAARAGAAQTRADVEGSIASAENAHADLLRDQELAKTHVIDRRELDNAVEHDKSTAAGVNSAREKIVGSDAQVALADAQLAASQGEVTQSEAAVHQAELNLSYCALDAPATGRVTTKNVEPGDYVQPGQALLAIVPHAVWVVANFKETQLTHMQAGQPTEVRVDAFPDQPLRGHVDSFQNGTGARFSLLPSQNATGNYVKIVQRVPVKIVLDEPVEALARLSPGMSVEASVKVR